VWDRFWSSGEVESFMRERCVELAAMRIGVPLRMSVKVTLLCLEVAKGFS